MKKEVFRVNKARQDQQVEETVDQVLMPDSFVRDLPPQQMIEAFTRLSLGALQDYQAILDKREAPPESYPDPAEMRQRAHHLGLCAWEHYRHHAQERFRVALIELMHESFVFADAIALQQQGASEGEIKGALPRREEVEQIVLRHAVIRLNQLPLFKEDNFWQGADSGIEDLPKQAEVARLIFKDLSLWTYDHAAVSTLLQKLIRPYLENHESPDGEATLWGDEAAELIWEHIDGAVQIILLILVNGVLLLSKQSAVKRQEVEIEPREAKQIQPSKENLKEIAETMISSWIDGLPFDWRGRGRPVKTSALLATERERMLTELLEIVRQIRASGNQVTWEGIAAGRKQRPRGSPQSGEALRKEAAALGLHIGDLKPEEN